MNRINATPEQSRRQAADRQARRHRRSHTSPIAPPEAQAVTDTLKATIRQMNDTLAHATQHNDTLKIKLTQAQTNLSAAIERAKHATTLETKLAQVETELATTIARALHAVALETKLAQLEAQLVKANTKVEHTATLETKLAHVQSVVAAASARGQHTAEVETRLTQVQAELSAACARVVAADTNSAQITNQYHGLTVNYKQACDSFYVMQAERDAALKGAAETAAALSVARNLIQQLNNDAFPGKVAAILGIKAVPNAVLAAVTKEHRAHVRSHDRLRVLSAAHERLKQEHEHLKQLCAAQGAPFTI